jgi:hypothetical protein
MARRESSEDYTLARFERMRRRDDLVAQRVAEQRERDVERMQEILKARQELHTPEDALAALEAEVYSNPIAHRRWNWSGMPEDTPAQRVYKALTGVQLDFQEADDEPAHDLLCDSVLDDFHRKFEEGLR